MYLHISIPLWDAINTLPKLQKGNRKIAVSLSFMGNSSQWAARIALGSYHQQQVRVYFTLSYTSTRALWNSYTLRWETAQSHSYFCHPCTVSVSPGTSWGLCTSIILRDSLPAMKMEFKSFWNSWTTLIAAFSKRLLLHQQCGCKSTRQEFLMHSL